MAQYLPPSENVPIFDTILFNQSDQALTYNSAIKKFLTYPIAQGTETFGDINVLGTMTTSNPTTYNVSSGQIATISDGTYTSKAKIVPYNSVALTGGQVLIGTDVDTVNSAGRNSVAIGTSNGSIGAIGISSVAIGSGSGYSGCGNFSVAIGSDALVGIGGTEVIAIGHNSANGGLGTRSIAIGANAATTSTQANCICITANGTVNPSTAGTYLNPIRAMPLQTTDYIKPMYYTTSAGGGTQYELVSGTSATTRTVGDVANTTITSATPYNILSTPITLVPGTWLINLYIQATGTTPGATSYVSATFVGLSTTTTTFTGGTGQLRVREMCVLPNATSTVGGNYTTILQVSTTATLYFNGQFTFSGATLVMTMVNASSFVQYTRIA